MLCCRQEQCTWDELSSECMGVQGIIIQLGAGKDQLSSVATDSCYSFFSSMLKTYSTSVTYNVQPRLPALVPNPTWLPLCPQFTQLWDSPISQRCSRTARNALVWEARFFYAPQAYHEIIVKIINTSLWGLCSILWDFYLFMDLIAQCFLHIWTFGH